MSLVSSCGVWKLPETVHSFGDDLDFLEQHIEVVVLSDAASAAQVVVAPGLQRRVMTSTLGGLSGFSHGWINRELIASGAKLPRFNPYGGEDRFWLGPEAGQFAIFFKPGDPFDLDRWSAPAPIDTEPFELVSVAANLVRMQTSMQLDNYAGARFHLQVEREIRLLNRQQVGEMLKIELDTQSIWSPLHPTTSSVIWVRRSGDGKPACCRSGYWGCSMPRRTPRQ